MTKVNLNKLSAAQLVLIHNAVGGGWGKLYGHRPGDAQP